MPAIFTASDLLVRYDNRVILDKASLSIDEKGRVGMVGRNGTGKSTFLKIVAGALEADAGTIARRRGMLVGYLSQEFTLDPNLNVMENIRAGAQHILDWIHAYETLPMDSPQHAEVEEKIMHCDGWSLDQRIATAMSKLGCPPAGSKIDTLSGGEKRRVALCRAIISQPDLLILDEPTNHLDTESIEWLGDFLEEYPGAFLLVTHDRYFLDRITNTIVELSNGQFFSYEGNYTDYLISKAERQAGEEVSEHKRQMFLQRELDWVRRSPKARTTKSKSRMDRYFETLGQKPPEAEGDMELVLPPPPQLGNRIVELVNVGVELGGRRLFSKLNFNFEGGQRLGITGRNGLGKTTLLKVILGQMEPTEGTVSTGQLTRFNYVDQGRMQLREDKSVLDELGEGTDYVSFGDHRLSLRTYLKRFLFNDETMTSLVKHLSGGERSRLLLARIMKKGGNFLILDEPTNDLDLPTMRVLEETLVAFPGIVLVVSHDRYFLNRVCTGILAFEGDGKVTYSVGNYDYYVEKRNRNTAAAVPAPAPVVRPSEPKKEAKAKVRKLTMKEAKELEGIEAGVQAAEEKVTELEARFLDPDFHRKYGKNAEELSAEVETAKEGVAALYKRWEELEAIRDAQEKA
jgi:ATP-binding cassette subfamily F protein uup